MSEQQALKSYLATIVTYARAGADLSRLIGKADQDYSDHIMVALYPDGELLSYLQARSKMDDVHLTLSYLGTLGEQVAGMKEAIACLSHFANSVPPIRGKLNGLARFCNLGDDGDAIVALFDSPQLPAARQLLVEMLQVDGLQTKMDHGFIPHFTLEHIDPGISFEMPNIENVPAAFDTVYLVWGPQKVPFKLRGI